MDGCESVTNDDREEFSGEKGFFFFVLFFELHRPSAGLSGLTRR